MKIVKSIIVKIINSLKHFIITSSNEQYCKYLRKHGVSVSGGVIFRYPHHTTIDVSRPGLISIGENVDIKYVFIFIFIYERQSVGGYGIPAIPTLP